MKKLYKKEHILNWYFGNYCAKCEKIDLEDENYGQKCFEKMKEVVKNIEANEITHKQFVDIIRNSDFCYPTTRKFCECKLCKFSGINNNYWVKNWKVWNLNVKTV